MPVVNVPMIDYTLEWLGSHGVDEVFVFCASHANAVEQYLRESRWTVLNHGAPRPCSPALWLPGGQSYGARNALAGVPVDHHDASWRRPVVRIERSNACTSAGDALRELDGKGVVQSDPFVLVSGDVVSNMDLKKVRRARPCAAPGVTTPRPAGDRGAQGAPPEGQVLHHDDRVQEGAAHAPHAHAQRRPAGGDQRACARGGANPTRAARS